MPRRFQFSLRALLFWSAIPAVFYAGIAVQSKLDERHAAQLIDRVRFTERLILEYERQCQLLSGKLEMRQAEVESKRRVPPAKPVAKK